MSAIGLALLLGGCSGSSTPAAETFPPEPPVTSPATVPTTSAPAPTTSTTTTTTEPEAVVDTIPSTDPVPAETTVDSIATTTDADTLPTPTDTLFAPDTVEGEIEQAVLNNFAAFVRCLDQLPNCDPQAATEYSALDYADGTTRNIEGWNSSGSLARNTETFAYDFLAVEEFSEDNLEALVLTCNFTGVEIFIPATEQNPEQITFGDPQSVVQRSLVQKIGGLWFVTATELVDKSFGEENNLCR